MRDRLRVNRGTRGNEGGFTFVELLVVLSILAVVIALALPGRTSLVQGTEAGAAARTILMSLRAARWKAVVSGCRIRFVTGFDAVRETFWYGFERESGPRWVLEGERGHVPRGVLLGATGPSIKVFNPNGTSSFGSVVLEGGGGKRFRLALNPMTGRVRLWRGTGEVGGGE